jgi:hypothetical protein
VIADEATGSGHQYACLLAHLRILFSGPGVPESCVGGSCNRW